MLLARAVGATTHVVLYDNPTVPQKIAAFTDRLKAVHSFSKGDMRGRWHGLIDRCLDVAIIWTVLRCVLIYREMIISGVGIIPTATGATVAGRGMKPSSIDNGIMRCASGILGNRLIRGAALDFLCTTCTFRVRAGLRTANRCPPGMNMKQVPWKGHAAVSVLNHSHASAGGFLGELEETLVSSATGTFDVAGRQFAYNTSRSEKPPKEECDEPAEGAPDPTKEPTQSALPFLQPSTFLLDFLARRCRSQALFALGPYSFSALLHPDVEWAQHRYRVIETRCRKVQALMGCNNVGKRVPGGVLLDLKRLCRNDLYMQLARCLMQVSNVHCCRLSFPPSDGLEESQNGPMDMHIGATGSQRGEECGGLNEKDAPTQGMTPGATSVGMAPGCRPIQRKCDYACHCGGSGKEMSDLLECSFAAMYGTKWNIEAGFNAVRKVKASCSVQSRGAAEIAGYTKHSAVHSNSLQHESPLRGAPVKLTDADWEVAPTPMRKNAKGTNLLYTAQSMESPGALYPTIKTLFGLSPPQKRTGASTDYSFVTVQPHRLLASAVSELLVCDVSERLWSMSWMCAMVPPGTIMFNPKRKKYLVVLDSVGAPMIMAWPCSFTLERTLSRPKLSFELDPVGPTQPEHLFVGANVYHGASDAPQEQDDEYAWYAVRTDPVTRGESGEVLRGGALTVRVPRPFLNGRVVNEYKIDGPAMFVEAHTERCPNAEMAHYMETVPLIEWLVEEGMPQSNASQRVEILLRIELDNLTARGETMESEDAARARLQREAPKDSALVFCRLLELVVPHFNDQEIEKAKAR